MSITVLLVDDDGTANFLHQSLLKRMGVASHVTVAENGRQALDLLAPPATPPQLILLDVNMPVMNGEEFLHEFVTLPLASPRPVVVLLSSSEQALRHARGQDLPIDAYLEKPLTREKVSAVLEQYFGEGDLVAT